MSPVKRTPTSGEPEPLFERPRRGPQRSARLVGGGKSMLTFQPNWGYKVVCMPEVGLMFDNQAAVLDLTRGGVITGWLR